MHAIYSTRPGVFAALIRLREAGSASHCAIGMGDMIVDATLRYGVREWTRADWLAEGHQIVAEYALPLPRPEDAAEWVRQVLAKRPRYDWLRIVGYALWRTLGSKRAYSCEELLLGAMLAGGLTLSDTPKRPGVRLLREIAHQRAAL